MLYTSERNYGCRFLEISLFGLRTVILENEKIRIMFLLDKGTDIIEFSYKKTDTDFIWRNPMGLSCLRKMQNIHMDYDCMSDNYLGGWFEAFPNVGGPCVYKGKSFPGHSEVSYLPWEYKVLRDEPEEVSLLCYVKTSKTPFLLEKTFTIKSEIPSLFIEEKVTNIGEAPIGFQWGHHPNIGGQFLNEDCIIDVPECEVSFQDEVEGSRFNAGTKGNWPYIIDKEGIVINLSHMPPRKSGINEFITLTDFKAGWGSVRNVKKGIGIGFSWDVEMFKNSLIWISANNDKGHHHHGGTYVMCILPKNTETLGLESGDRAGELPVIEGGAVRYSWFTATAFEDSGKVVGIDKNGSVLFDNDKNQYHCAAKNHIL